ncbi:hypothetical protein M422DRAFT_240548 [Sphaerobolus stellatus SS14]|nr:hypothetical protein M422DRAFT_240548 [Sphaerobolus stellatus SS14]
MLSRAYITAAICHGNLHVATVEQEVVGVICWYGPHQEMDLTENTYYSQFWRELDNIRKVWLQEQFYLVVKEKLPRIGYPLTLGSKDRYLIQYLGIKGGYEGNEVGVKLIQECLNKVRQDSRIEAAVACSIAPQHMLSEFLAAGMNTTAFMTCPSPWSTNGICLYSIVYQKAAPADHRLLGVWNG